MRKAAPYCIRAFLSYLNDGQVATREQLVSALANGNRPKGESQRIIECAIEDGLLVHTRNEKQKQSEVNISSPKRRAIEKLRLPMSKEINAMETDAYCFECHLPGELEQCRKCHRAFHGECYRVHPERPLYKVPSAKLQKNRLPVFSSESNGGSDETDNETEHDNNNENDMLKRPVFAPETISQTIPQQNLFNNDNIYDHKPLADYDIDMDVEEKSDVFCVGEIRAATRRRPATTASTISYKSELTHDDQVLENEERELCTCCRLLATATLRNPVNMQSDELCHLLNSSFTRNRSWVAYDVQSYLITKKLSTDELKAICKLLFMPPVKSINMISDKLQNKKYNFLMEMLVDLLDIQHAFGVFFGVESNEYDSTKWLIRDIQHDISEIRRCPDCYRYSTEKISDLWFAFPCVQRHELVFAKHSGFSFWPAKIIRVLSNSKYDVRFFGTDHSRALIEARNIRSIDTNVKLLKLRNTNTLKKAIEELHYHQQLSKSYSATDFSFYANPLDIAKIIQNVRGANMLDTMRCQRGRQSITSPVQLNLNANTDNSLSTESAPIIVATPTTSGPNFKRKLQEKGKVRRSYRISENLDGNCNKAEVRRNTRMNSVIRQTRATAKVDSSKIPKEISEVLDQLEKAKTFIKELQQKNNKQRKQIQAYKEKVNLLEQQKNLIKRKPWCYWCLEEATYLCCFRATYCSPVCQARHWNDSHYKECRHEGNTQL